VLSLSFTYVLALLTMTIIHDILPDDTEQDAKYLTQQSFGSVIWSMFTMFRCFTDGCSAFDGTPLQVHLSAYFGEFFMVAYVVIYLFVTVGIFNLIMATFLDYVMAVSCKRRQHEREINAAKMERCLRQLVAELCERHSSYHTAVGKNSNLLACCWRFRGAKQRIKEVAKLDPSMTVSKIVFNTWLSDQRMLDLLDDMDIASASRNRLFDVLDSNMSGHLKVKEIISGLMKLRGPAEKCDVIATLLSVKHMMSSVEDLRSAVSGMIGNSGPAGDKGIAARPHALAYI